MQSRARTVPGYLKELPPDRRQALASLRKLIKEVAPDAREIMNYGMPTYVIADCPIIALASQKRHLAIYVCAWQAMNRFRSRLGKTNCGKGCIRFRQLADLKLPVVEQLLAAAAAEARSAR